MIPEAPQDAGLRRFAEHQRRRKATTGTLCDVLAITVKSFVGSRPPLHRLQSLGGPSFATVMLELHPSLADAHLREFGRADQIHLGNSSPPASHGAHLFAQRLSEHLVRHGRFTEVETT